MQATTATDAYVQNHTEALVLLDEIEDLLLDLPVPALEGFLPSWGHAGDLEVVLKKLREVRDEMIRI